MCLKLLRQNSQVFFDVFMVDDASFLGLKFVGGLLVIVYLVYVFMFFPYMYGLIGLGMFLFVCISLCLCFLVARGFVL